MKKLTLFGCILHLVAGLISAPAQTYQWMYQENGFMGVNEHSNLQTSCFEAPIIVGTFSGTCVFKLTNDSTVSFTSNGDYDIFIGCSDGKNFYWVTQLGGPENDWADSLFFNHAGELHVRWFSTNVEYFPLSEENVPQAEDETRKVIGLNRFNGQLISVNGK